MKMLKKKNSQDSSTSTLTEEGSNQSGSSESNLVNDFDKGLNLEYLINEIGCENVRIRKDPKLLD